MILEEDWGLPKLTLGQAIQAVVREEVEEEKNLATPLTTDQEKEQFI